MSPYESIGLREGPALVCADCDLAPFALYGPTVCANSNRITNLRKEIRRLPAGKLILREGEPARSAYTLEDGWAFSFMQLPDGRRQILGILIPADIICLEIFWCYPGAAPFSVKSITPVRLCEFDVASLKEVLTASPEQQAKLARSAELHMEQLFRRMTDIGRRAASARVAQFLLDIHARLSERQMAAGNRICFPLRQEHIADALGLTTIYVNRALMAFRKDQLIELQDYQLALLNIDGLRRVAEEG